MIKTIDTEVGTREMLDAFNKECGEYVDEILLGIKAALEAAPEVKAEPVAWRLTNTSYRKPVFEYYKSKKEAEQRKADFNRSVDDGGLYNLTPLYIHSPAVSEGWLRAIDEALVMHDIDVANADDDYATAKDKLNKLLCVVQDIGAYFAKQESAQSAAEPVAWGAFYFGGKSAGKLYSHCETKGQIENYIANVHRSDDSITLRAAPLYTNPPSVPPAIERKPLTDEQICEIALPFVSRIGGHWEYGHGIEEGRVEDFARAIERAHGILEAGNE